ncbi:MAG TPA: glycoside hydrolase family 76 protein [Actinomycetota bacterium]|nr:glycoside hydrolase family 76 protein [Actinomycetota bacterium]
MWAELALDAWVALVRDTVRRRWDRSRVLDGPGGKPAAAWPLAHILWAAAEIRALGGNPPIEELDNALGRLRSRDGYLAVPRDKRYFDDNAWLGLAFLRLSVVLDQPAWQERARGLARFVMQGEDPDGGVRWVEGSSSRNTCSTASAAWLVQAAGEPDAPTVAGRWLRWLDATLRRPDGLYADRIENGVVHDEAWTYNQGAALAATRLLGRPTAPLRAAILKRWSPDDLWREPPAFAAIAYRALLEDPDPTDAVERWDPYLERLRADAHEPNGWYTGGGVGRYDEHPMIDQAAVIQLFALRATVTSGARRSPA